MAPAIRSRSAAAGRLAVQIAKHLGAKRVIATARNADALKSVAALGADVTMPLRHNPANWSLDAADGQCGAGRQSLTGHTLVVSPDGRLSIDSEKGRHTLAPGEWDDFKLKMLPSVNKASLALLRRALGLLIEHLEQSQDLYRFA